MKKEILQMMKQQLHTVADRLTLENYKEMESEMYRIFIMLESADAMLEVADLPVEAEQAETEEAEPSLEEIPTETEEQEPETVPHELKKNKRYRFERKIKGGVLPEISAFVPERAVRDLDLHEGDLLHATFLNQPDSGPTHYGFEVAERSGGPRSPEGLVEIEMGILKERMDGTYYIDKTVNSDHILYNDKPHTFEVSSDDVRSLRLVEDDIVNGAFYANNPQTLRIRWRYQTSGSDTASTAPKPSSYYKKKDADAQKDVEQIFEGKTICAMGYVPGHAAYAEEVEARGGAFLGLSGKESQASMASALSKSDALVMNLKHVSHSGTQSAVSYCKEHGIPYDSISTFGRSSFVDAAANLLGK